MKVSFPNWASWQIAARRFNQLKHIHLDLSSEKIGPFEDLMEFIEMFVENQNSLRKVTLQFDNLYIFAKVIIKELRSNIKFMTWSKVITFNLQYESSV